MKKIKLLESFFKSHYLITVLVVIMIFLFFGIRNFYSYFNFKSIFTMTAIFGFLALAESLVVLTGGIDLSVGNVASLSTVVCVFLSIVLPGEMNVIFKIVIIIFGALLSGAFVGTISGFSVTRLKIPPLIATLATMWIARAFAFFPLKAVPTPIKIEEFNMLGSKTFFKIPLSFFILIMVALLTFFILRNVRAGRYIYFIGGDEYSAFLSGVKVKKIKLCVYIFSGILSAIGGIFIAAWTKTGFPRAAEGYELIIIAAVVMGGFSLFGGVGNIWDALLGVFTLRVISKIVAFANISPFAEGVFIGTILLISLYITTLRRREAWR